MSQTILSVAFKWPGVLSRGFTVSQPPIIGFEAGTCGFQNIYKQVVTFLTDQAKMLTQRSLISVTISNMAPLVWKEKEGAVLFRADNEDSQFFSHSQDFPNAAQ